MSQQNMDYLRAQYSFFTEFEDIVDSAEEKVIKPATEIFKILLQRNDLTAEHTLFIDDTKINCEAAEALGIHSIHLPPGRDLNSALNDFEIM